MSDDFSDKIEQLKDMLNKPEFKDNIKNVMSLVPEGQNPYSHSNNDENFVNTLQKVMEKKSQMHDPRINLLNAIKPYLNPKRQQRIDSYSKIMNITMLSKFLNE